MHFNVCAESFILHVLVKKNLTLIGKIDSCSNRIWFYNERLSSDPGMPWLNFGNLEAQCCKVSQQATFDSILSHKDTCLIFQLPLVRCCLLRSANLNWTTPASLGLSQPSSASAATLPASSAPDSSSLVRHL